MKKILSLVLALILGFIGTTPATMADVATNALQEQMDLTNETKTIIWETGYKTRCRTKIRQTKKHTLMKRVLLLPLSLFIGTACAEEPKRIRRTERNKALYVETPKRDKTTFIVEYEKDDRIHKKEFSDYKEAEGAYFKIKQFNPEMPRRFSNCTASIAVALQSHNWSWRQEKKLEVKAWRDNAIQRLKASKIHQPQIDAVMRMSVKDIRKAVAGRNIDKFCELDGVAEKTAKTVIFALKPICRPEKLKTYGSKEFVRAILTETEDGPGFQFDLIRKGVAPVEAKAFALGGENAIIHVVSKIEEVSEDDLEGQARVEAMSEFWTKACREGLEFNDKKYVPFGHGTNAAKECKTLWVLSGIHREMKKWADKGVSENWQTTAAKRFAYMVGLQAVTRHSCNIPFHPEDFVILPSVITMTRGNHTKEFLDGHEEDLDDHEEPVNRSDGYFIIDIPESMYPEMINRMILERGMEPTEAEETLMAFVNDTSVNSYRANGAALKGCGDKHVYAHKYLWSKGVTHTPDGRDLHNIAVFVDETVVKTSIGPNGAYPTFEAWCDAVRDELDLGICVKAHKKAKKDVSYQVIQAICEASKEAVVGMATDTLLRIQQAHTVEGASHLLNREIGHILRILPTLGNERNVKEKIERKLEDLINDAFSGKLLRQSYYLFITPDPILILQGWFGLEMTGCLNEGEFHIGRTSYGKKVGWRSPVMHPNAVRTFNNVPIKKEFREFFKSDEFVMMMNSKDDISLAWDADWDGDHASFSDFEWLILAAEETLKIWDRLIIWETPKPGKSAITRKDEIKYVAGLTHTNELGLTVYGLNALLNRIKTFFNKETGESWTEVIPLTKRGINFKKFAGNVLVDASKHGGAEIDEPEESAQCSDMQQPWAKKYRDAVKHKELWRVYVKSVGETFYFVTKAEADKFVQNELNRCKKTNQQPSILGPFNHLDELANISMKDPKHATGGTLNKIFWILAKKADRSLNIYDIPKEKFDFHKLMFNPEESRRGLTGLIRMGRLKVVTLDGETMRPDQGLFDSLASHLERDRTIYQSDGHKDFEDTSFEETWRVNALAEIQTFAESCGATLEDAYDVITWQMFMFTDEQYSKMDGKLDFLRDNLWQAYWLIFGGMAEEAAERWEEKEDAD